MSRRRTEKEPVVLTDPRAIRALAHPARLLVIDRLYAGEIATSTDLADAAGLSPSAMSYHLRALEKYGIVERVEHADDGRQRPWRARGSGLTIKSDNPRGTLAAEAALLGTMLSADQEAVAVFLAGQAEESPEWRDGLRVNSSQVVMTTEELAAINETVDAALDGFGAAQRRDPPPGARRVRLTFLTVPAPE